NLNPQDSYIGSALDLSFRLKKFLLTCFFLRELTKGNSIIYKALLKHGYSSFRL
ncbi:uncharacterized protein EURHEDRAFT_536258, partial [Aspergillus ruber CBS 135680]